MFLRFRENRVAFIGNISKMFHSIEIATEDQMTHLFLWRNLDITIPPTTHAITAVNMGDRPSSAIAQIALRETALMNQEDHPDACSVIISNSYMDDIADSSETIEDARNIMENIDKVLKEGGFKIKEWIITGQKN